MNKKKIMCNVLAACLGFNLFMGGIAVSADNNVNSNEDSKEITSSIDESAGEIIWGEDADYSWHNKYSWGYPVCTINGIEFTSYRNNASVEKCDQEKGGDLVLPDKIKVGEVYYKLNNIKGDAFSGCDNLNNITLGENINIDKWAFQNCKNLKNIHVDKNNKYLSDIDGVLFNKSKTELIQYPQEKEESSYTVPSSVKTLYQGSFKDNDNLINVTLPNNLTQIGYSAFERCDKLSNITIPDSVTKIENNAFSDCNSLEYISVGKDNEKYCDIDGVLFTKDMNELMQYPLGKKEENYIMPNGVNQIDTGSFSNANNLTNVTIGDGVTKIRYDAFRACENLRNVTIPNTVTTIEYEAFYDCKKLENVVIPASVKNMQQNIFLGCSSLQYISVDKDNENYCDKDGILFTKDMKELIKYPQAKAGETYTISGDITKIHPRAFEGTNNLTSIIIEDGFTNIGLEAFGSCRSLKNIVIPNTVTNIEYYAFFNCDQLNHVVIPDSVKRIAQYSFKNCKNLSDITLPDTDINIERLAFEGCNIQQ